MMNATDVINLYTDLEKLRIKIWIDGGWGVDALLGKQTRLHEDLDIVIQKKDLLKFRKLVEAQEYKEVKEDDATAWNFVLKDGKKHLIDVHVIVFDREGNGIYGPREKGMMYSVGSLDGNGMIDGYKVRCISPEEMIKFHGGYKLDKNDIKDVIALCDHFGFVYPKETTRG